MSELRTTLCDDFGIKYPIMQAGMGMRGLATPPELVAAVSNAGGMGFLGCSWLDAEEVRRRIRRVKELTDKPFGVNLLLPASMDNASIPDRGEMRLRIRKDHPAHAQFLEDLLTTHGLEPVEAAGTAMSPDFIRAQVDAFVEEGVSAFAAGLGDPGWAVPRVHAAGIKVLGLAGTVRNAARQVDAGVDYVITQGYEAGGHTGTIANFALIPAVVEAISPKPVIAAGAIASGQAMVSALALGAVGVWIGTAFLLSEETHTPARHQEAIIDGAAEDFVITRAYTGKTARDYRNDVIKAWEASGLRALPMPLQGILMDDFVAAATKAKRDDLTNNAAGQISGMLTQKRPAKDIVMRIVEEAERSMDRLEAMRA